MTYGLKLMIGALLLTVLALAGLFIKYNVVGISEAGRANPALYFLATNLTRKLPVWSPVDEPKFTVRPRDGESGPFDRLAYCSSLPVETLLDQYRDYFRNHQCSPEISGQEDVPGNVSFVCRVANIPRIELGIGSRAKCNAVFITLFRRG